MGLNDPLRSRLFPIRAALTFSLSELCRGSVQDIGEGNIRGALLFLITGADKHCSTITPVRRCQVQCQVGLLHHQPSAATIHLRFVYFSGRYKMTQFPLSSHSPEAVSDVMNHFIFWSLVDGGETEQQAYCKLNVLHIHFYRP